MLVTAVQPMHLSLAGEVTHLLHMETLFFISSKTLGVLARADVWILVLAGALVLAELTGRRRVTRRLALANIILVVAVGFFPFGNLLIAPLERVNPPADYLDPPDGIIVLGGGEDRLATRRWGHLQLNAASERFSSAAQLARQYPRARIIFSGGQGRLGPLREDQLPFSRIVRKYFFGLGVDPDLVVLESQSRNTAENAKMSFALVQPKPGERWVLVTSAFHMNRALRSFERAGWTGLQPYPVDYRSHVAGARVGWRLSENLDTANVALKEWIGLAVYAITGR